ncbi:hypothetical protein [Bosea sp. (in: a-proteobacteria)]|jgi:hypothetical protein|uniref:hypothetical protein n=1 Tax=Bosea sp. (in: a-proteobacteria) TaxID=1871050 RepID=UPI003F713E34
MWTGNSRRYLILLLAQTICAAIILYHIQSAFRVLLDSIGRPNSASLSNVIQLACAALAGQACYWWRLRKVAVPNSYRNVFLGHLLAFASRIGFIFGGALFSLYFLRHVPALDLGYLDLSWRGALLIAILFALYCYLLELERLGNAFQERSRARVPGEPG